MKVDSLKPDPNPIAPRLHPDAWSDIIEEHPELAEDIAEFAQSGLDEIFSAVGAITLLRLRARHLLAGLRGEVISDEGEETVPGSSFQ